MRRKVLGVAALLCLAGAAAHAQNYLDYASVRFPFEAGNGGVDYLEFYKTASIKSGLARESLSYELDLPYGEDSKQRIDVFTSKQKPSNAPVFLFVHGGGFEEGDRAHYGYVAGPLAEHGIVTALMSYRLVKRAKDNKIHYRDQEADVRAAIVWVYRNIAKHGGDPNRIFIGGHSAGALLSANVGSDRSWMAKAGIPREALRGVVAISGGFANWSDSPLTLAAAPTPEERVRMNPIALVTDPAPEFVLARGEKEKSIRFSEGAVQMKTALESKGAKATIVVEPAADHGGAVFALSREDSLETQALIKMIERSAR
ncbi:MAG: alpha/beta hydrolase [Pseudomonadota bacterium]|nr:alpha/beta hydrolase [Pseudomonadota bacterium]